jgi:hypothetical protein
VFLFPWKFGEVVIVFLTLLDLASLVFFLPEEFGKVLLFISLTLLLYSTSQDNPRNMVCTQSVSWIFYLCPLIFNLSF